MSTYVQCINRAKNYVDFSKPVVVFDLGCNIEKINKSNNYLEDFTSIAFKCFDEIEKVWAFEPVFHERYEQIYKNNDKVVLTKKAVDQDSGTKMFFVVPPSSGLSSFVQRPIYTSFVKRKVDSVSVDEFCEQNKIDHIDYLKVDTEGAELRVLKGSKRMLSEKRISAVQLEHGGTYEDAGYTLDDVKNYITSFGYTERFFNATEMVFTI